MSDEQPSGITTFNIGAAVHLLIDRVDRLERVLRDVRAVLPQPSVLREPMRESHAGPSDRERLELIGVALQGLDDA